MGQVSSSESQPFHIITVILPVNPIAQVIHQSALKNLPVFLSRFNPTSSSSASSFLHLSFSEKYFTAKYVAIKAKEHIMIKFIVKYLRVKKHSSALHYNISVRNIIKIIRIIGVARPQLQIKFITNSFDHLD